MDTTLRSCILCAFLANRVRSFGVFFYSVGFPPCGMPTILPSLSQLVFHGCGSISVISSTGLEVGVHHHSICFVAVLPFFVGVTAMLGTVANSRR